MFKLIYELQPAGEFDSLKAAIKTFVEKVKENLGGCLSYQVLETACWVEGPGGSLLNFYHARDYAIDQGWMSPAGGYWLVD